MIFLINTSRITNIRLFFIHIGKVPVADFQIP